MVSWTCRVSPDTTCPVVVVRVPPLIRYSPPMIDTGVGTSMPCIVIVLDVTEVDKA